MISNVTSTIQNMGSMAAELAARLPDISEITLANVGEIFRKLPSTLTYAIDAQLELIEVNLGAQLKKLAGRASDTWWPTEWQNLIEEIMADPLHPLHAEMNRVMALRSAFQDNPLIVTLQDFAADMAECNWYNISFLRQDYVQEAKKALSELSVSERAFYDAFVEKFFV